MERPRFIFIDSLPYLRYMTKNMKRPKSGFFVLILLVCFSPSGFAQTQFSGWFASFNTFRLGNKFSLHFDAQLRSTDGWDRVNAILLRPGLNYHLNKTWTFTAGYALIPNRRNIGAVSSLLPEHRIWQQALLSHRLKNIALSNRFRFEERFLPKAAIAGDDLETDGFNKAFRFRYFVRSLFPLASGNSFAKGPFLALQNEVLLNTGDKSAVNGKTFDQNRLYGAVGYRLPGKLDLEVGYMNQYINTRTSFTNNHILQLAVYKRL